MEIAKKERKNIWKAKISWNGRKAAAKKAGTIREGKCEKEGMDWKG